MHVRICGCCLCFHVTVHRKMRHAKASQGYYCDVYHGWGESSFLCSSAVVSSHSSVRGVFMKNISFMIASGTSLNHWQIGATKSTINECNFSWIHQPQPSAIDWNSVKTETKQSVCVFFKEKMSSNILDCSKFFTLQPSCLHLCSHQKNRF